MLGKLFVLGLLAGLAAGQDPGNKTLVINELVDQVVESWKEILQLKGRVAVGNLDQTFQTQVWGVPVTGYFNASNGTLLGLDTLERTGNATSQALEKFVVKAQLGFKDFGGVYDIYNFTYLKIQSQGSMQVNMYGVSGSFDIALIKKGTSCNVAVESAVVDYLDKMTLVLNGPQVLNQFITQLGNWMTKNYVNLIREAANNHLHTTLQETIDKMPDMCNMIPFM